MELFRQKIATEHQQRIKDHEENLRKIQKERQAVFDDAFRHDLEEFKQKGHIPSKFYENYINIFFFLLIFIIFSKKYIPVYHKRFLWKKWF